MLFKFEGIRQSGYIQSMKKILIGSLCILLTSCATAPDPEQICTAEWIGARSDKALNSIESKAGRSIKSLTKAAESWAKGKTPGLFQMLALQNSFKGLEKELLNGTGMKDLRTLASTCNDPDIISKAMGTLLRKQDLPDNLINFIENFEPYKKLIAPQLETLKTAGVLTP